MRGSDDLAGYDRRQEQVLDFSDHMVLSSLLCCCSSWSLRQCTLLGSFRLSWVSIRAQTLCQVRPSILQLFLLELLSFIFLWHRRIVCAGGWMNKSECSTHSQYKARYLLQVVLVISWWWLSLVYITIVSSFVLFPERYLHWKLCFLTNVESHKFANTYAGLSDTYLSVWCIRINIQNRTDPFEGWWFVGGQCEKCDKCECHGDAVDAGCLRLAICLHFSFELFTQNAYSRTFLIVAFKFTYTCKLMRIERGRRLGVVDRFSVAICMMPGESSSFFWTLNLSSSNPTFYACLYKNKAALNSMRDM